MKTPEIKFIVFNRALSLEEQQLIEGVMAKYGISDPSELLLKVLTNAPAVAPFADLPSDHPYRDPAALPSTGAA